MANRKMVFILIGKTDMKYPIIIIKLWDSLVELFSHESQGNDFVCIYIYHGYIKEYIFIFWRSFIHLIDLK